MSGEKARILIVDDEPINLDVLVDLLRKDYQTIVAKSGAAALKRARSVPPPDLILLDVMMPEMDGFEVCNVLKTDTATCAIPIVFVTGMSDVADEARGFQAGAVDFIKKPISAPQVLVRVKNCLEMENQKRHLRELNALKNRFLGMAAHDLRNPLSAIRGFCQLMRTVTLSEEEKKLYLDTMFHTSSDALHLVNDLLDVSVIEGGHLQVQLAECSLDDLVKERVRLLAPNATHKEIRISTLLEPQRLPLDKSRIQQVVDNLLSNAIKFSPAGSTIDIRVTGQGGCVYLDVKDRGPGVSDPDRERLFTPFQKLSAQPTGGETSTGLGLSIVKKIVEAHQGTIRVENNTGPGCTFRVGFVR
ncbi:MAG: hybrid sensor histidine kinase/response regulator [Magnetococcales bacterium]|nr:hybrid sensor histidine kinase/response regulator [Magnetococcales bacterium]